VSFQIADKTAHQCILRFRRHAGADLLFRQPHCQIRAVALQFQAGGFAGGRDFLFGLRLGLDDFRRRVPPEAPGFRLFFLHRLGAQRGKFRLLPHNSIVVGLYIPLIFAIPFAIAHVSEWSTHRYVITPLRVIIHSGIFDYHMHGILLSRVVDAQQDYTFWQQFLNYGDIVFRETSGEAETLECVWGPKKFAKLATRYSHALEGASPQGKEDIEAG